MTNPLVRKLRHGAALSPKDEDVLAGLTAPVLRIGARQDIVREGERPEALTLILEGWACHYRDLPDGRRQIMTFFLPGDLCEPYGLLPDVMDHSLGTITPVACVRVQPADVETATRASAAIQRAFWWDILIAKSLLYERAVSLGRRTALERLGHLLCEIHARLALVGLADEAGCVLPATQHDLANALGTSDVHLNRSLQTLRSTGLVTVSDRRLVIQDLEGLRDLALFDLNFLHLPRSGARANRPDRLPFRS